MDSSHNGLGGVMLSPYHDVLFALISNKLYAFYDKKIKHENKCCVYSLTVNNIHIIFHVRLTIDSQFSA